MMNHQNDYNKKKQKKQTAKLVGIERNDCVHTTESIENDVKNT